MAKLYVNHMDGETEIIEGAELEEETPSIIILRSGGFDKIIPAHTEEHLKF